MNDTLKAGVAVRDITPPTGTELTGFIAREQPSTGVRDPLFVRALWLASGGERLLWLQADLLGLPVARPRVIETTALGAAYLAGLAVGFWQSPDEIAHQWAEERRFTPAFPPGERAARRAAWNKALARAKGWEDPE